MDIIIIRINFENKRRNKRRIKKTNVDLNPIALIILIKKRKEKAQIQPFVCNTVPNTIWYKA